MSAERYSVGKKLLLFSAAAFLAAKAWEKNQATDFKGKLVLVTGGGSGLGFALARTFLRNGARVIICGRSEAKLRSAAQRLEAEGDVYFSVCDVRSHAQVRNLVDEVLERHGALDVLVNNAGIIHVGPQEAMSDDDFNDTLNTNYWGVYHMCRQWLPHMRRGARIANITSVGGVVPVPRMLPYTVAKFAAYGFSEGLRAEMQPKGIKVTTVVPGLMQTGSHINAIYHDHAAAEYRWFSTGAGSPAISLSPEKAAAKILNAVRLGRGRAYIGWEVPLAHWLYTAMPNFTTAAIGTAAVMLGGKKGERQPAIEGKQLQQPPVVLPFVTESLQQARAEYQPPH